MSLPQAPQVQVPQAPLPKVQVPQVTAPSVPAPVPSAPSLPVPTSPQVQLPQVNVPSVSAPRLPSAPQAPSVQVPSTGGGGAGTSTPAAAAPAPAATASASAPSGPVAGAPDSSPRARRAARATALRGGKGVFGTSYRTRRRLVRALSGCVQGLPTRQESLLTLRYGVGGTAAQPADEVARALGLSAAEYVAVRRQALRGLVRAARAGSCEEGGAGATFARVFSAGGPAAVGSAIASAAGRSGSGSAAASRQENVAALAGGSFDVDEAADTDRRSGFTTPLALDTADPASGPSTAGMALAGALALLSLIALKPLLARRRRRSHSGV